MTHPQIGRALRLMNMEKNGTPTVAEFEALLTDAGRLDACIELMQRPGATGQIAGYPNLLAALAGTDAGLALALSNASAMAAAAKRPSAMLSFINDQSALDAIFSKPDVLAVFLASTALAKASVPSMTSNAMPAGVASASTEYDAAYQAWRAFDKVALQAWASINGAVENAWIRYSFDSAVFINSAIVSNYISPYGVVNCRVECSSNGVNFDVVKSTTLEQGKATEIRFAKSGFYKHWRLFVETSGGGSRCGLYELNFTGFFAP